MDDLHAQIEFERAKMQLFALKMITYTLVGVMAATITVLLVGLFMPNDQISNDEIWRVLGPSFFTVSGAVTGAFATMMGMKTKEFDPNAAQKTYSDTVASDNERRSDEAKADATVEVQQAKSEATVAVAKIEADAAIEMAKLESGYYKPFTYEDGHVDPEAQEGSKADARWDVAEEGAEQPAEAHWTQRI